jgi:predicted nucleotidyltransferase
LNRSSDIDIAVKKKLSRNILKKTLNFESIERSVMPTKFDIYVCITITVLIPLLVDY